MWQNNAIFNATAQPNVSSPMTYIKLRTESFQGDVCLALNFCAMLVFLLQLNLMFATGFQRAELGTEEFSIFQVAVFY